MQRIGDHGRIESFLTGNSINTLFSFVNFFIFAFVLAYYNLVILGIFLLGNTLYVAWILSFMKYRRELDHKRFAQSAGEQSNIIQLITGLQEIKLNNRDSVMFSKKVISENEYELSKSSFLQSKQAYLSFNASLKQTELQLMQEEESLLDLQQQASELESKYRLTLHNATEGFYVVEVDFPNGMETNYGRLLPISRQMQGMAEYHHRGLAVDGTVLYAGEENFKKPKIR